MLGTRIEEGVSSRTPRILHSIRISPMDAQPVACQWAWFLGPWLCGVCFHHCHGRPSPLLPTGRCQEPCVSVLRFDIRLDREPEQRGLYRDQNPLSVSGWIGRAKTLVKDTGKLGGRLRIAAMSPLGLPATTLVSGECGAMWFRITMMSWMSPPIQNGWAQAHRRLQ